MALTIITSFDAVDLDPELEKFRAKLKSLGASVIVLRVTDPGCVLSSQVKYIQSASLPDNQIVVKIETELVE